MSYNTGKKVFLMYHRVDDTTQDYNRITVNEKNFKAQMTFLKENYKVLSVEDMLAYEGSEDVIAITFDDGFADFYTKALPILEELNLPAAIFVTTGKMDIAEEMWTSEIMRLLYMNDSGCDELCIEVMGKKVGLPIFTLDQRAHTYRCMRQILMQLSGDEVDALLADIRGQLNMETAGRGEYLFLSTEQCKELGKHPLVTVGAHTVNHVSLGRTEEAVVEYEIKNSIKQLENILEKKIEYFAYPFGGNGDYSKQAIDILKECGIKAAFTTYSSVYNSEAFGLYEIPRMYVGNWEVNKLKAKIDGGLSPDVFFDGKNSCNDDFYLGSLAEDKELWETDIPVIVWGTGVRGKRIKENLVRSGNADRIIAFGDNNSKLWGEKIDGIEVWSPEKIVGFVDAIVIVNNAQDGKICRQLSRMGVKKIHWVV